MKRAGRKEGRQQNQVHLSRLRPERLGQTQRPGPLRGVRTPATSGLYRTIQKQPPPKVTMQSLTEQPKQRLMLPSSSPPATCRWHARAVVCSDGADRPSSPLQSGRCSRCNTLIACVRRRL
jgi:hypothetical protein